jgi:hypothetical protein
MESVAGNRRCLEPSFRLLGISLGRGHKLGLRGEVKTCIRSGSCRCIVLARDEHPRLQSTTVLSTRDHDEIAVSVLQQVLECRVRSGKGSVPSLQTSSSPQHNQSLNNTCLDGARVLVLFRAPPKATRGLNHDSTSNLSLVFSESPFRQSSLHISESLSG